MLWALLAAYLTKRPPWVQSCVVGLCTGLFVAAGAHADQRNPVLGNVVIQVLAVGAVAGAAFFLALRSRLRHVAGGAGPPAWVHAVYVAVWLLAIGAAARAFVGDGGVKVAVLAVVPIVLLAPPALLGIRTLARRSPREAHAGEPGAPA